MPRRRLIRDAAGQKLRLGAVLEQDQRFHFVGMTAVAGAAAGAHIGDGARDQLMDEIEIVDHQIEHGADIGAAAGPRTRAPAFDLERRVAEIEQPALREDETFLMADGEHTALVLGQRDQRIGFGKIGRDRLFDQHVGAGFEKGAHDLGMGDRRRADGNDIDLAQQAPPVGHGRHAMGGHRMRARLDIRVGDGDKLDAGHRRIFRGVMTAEGADADDGGTQGGRNWDWNANKENPRDDIGTYEPQRPSARDS